MSHCRRFIVLYLFCALIQHSYAQINFPQGSTFSYLKGNAASSTPAELLAATYNVTNWSSGIAPFRYGKGTGGTVMSDMQNNYSTFYLRTNFNAQNSELIRKITFNANYDDAFVISINGITALSVNAPTTLSHTALAFSNHDPGTNVSYIVDATKLKLTNGINTLAVMVLNVTLNSSDIHFDVSMTAEPEEPPTPPAPTYAYDNKVVFSKTAGFYKDVFDLTLSSPLPDCNVLYTIDGSDPKTSKTATLGSSNVTLTIDPAQPVGRGATPGYVVRASLVKTGYAPSNSTANTYLFLSKVKTQSYPGGKWPSTSVNGQSLKYAMDQTVANNATYSPYFDAALKQIPTISITMEMDSLFGSSGGIYVNAAQSGRAWERPCSVELIDSGNVQKFQINAGLRIRGANSAKTPSNPKHAFRFYFREEYGAKKLLYPLFETEGTDEYDCIDLRCEQNYSWSMDKSPYNSMVTDIFSRDLQGKMGQPYKRGRYYHLYLNGLYWGLFQTDERAEADYAESYLGGNDADYDVIKTNSDGWPYWDEATDGYMDTWSALWTKCTNGFESNANYFSLLGKKPDGSPDPNGKVWVDVDNLIDYMLVIFYTDNFDAPVSWWYSDDMPNNFYALYNRNDKTKGFKFLTHDSEHSMFVNSVNGGSLQGNRVNIGSNGSMNITQMNKFNPQWLHFKMSSNAEYRQRFADRAYQQLNKGGFLTPEATASIYKSRAAQIDYAVIAESARWGNSNLTKQTWLDLIQSMYTTFFPQRSAILQKQLSDESLYTTMAAPDIKLDGSSFFDRFKSFTGSKTIWMLDYQGSGCTVYYTVDGTDPRAPLGAVAASAKSGLNAVSQVINQTTVLNSRLYKSGVWGPLRTILFSNANEDYSKLKVTELNYHPMDSIIGTDTIEGQDFEFIEFKNTGTNPIDLSGLKLDSAIYYQFPDQQILEPGAFYVIASKPNLFFSKYNRYPSGNFSKNLSNSGEEVLMFNRNNKAVLSFTYDDGDPWPTTPDGDGYSLTTKYANPIGNPAYYDYWIASTTMNGTPFMDDFNSLTSLNPNATSDEKIVVYPNPTNGIFYVNIGQTQNGMKYQVSVYDTKGTLILQKQCEHTGIIDLNGQMMNNGVYIVKIQTTSKTFAQKIIYMR